MQRRETAAIVLRVFPQKEKDANIGRCDILFKPFKIAMQALSEDEMLIRLALTLLHPHPSTRPACNSAADGGSKQATSTNFPGL